MEVAARKCTQCGENPQYDGGWCLVCRKMYQRRIRSERREEINARNMDSYCRTEYGISHSEAVELRTTRVCAICGQRKKRMVIDHTHRGSYHDVLCQPCNILLGFLNHDPKLLHRAAEYLEQTRGGVVWTLAAAT